jgi:hypothetical protein
MQAEALKCLACIRIADTLTFCFINPVSTVKKSILFYY